MGVSVFPAPSAGGGAALPQGATANVASVYASKGGWRYTTSTPAGTYQVAVQSASDYIYGVETANGVKEGELIGNSVAPLKLDSTESSITVGSYYPFVKTNLSIANTNVSFVNGSNNLFIAQTTSGYLYTSPDSITWTARTSGLEGDGYINGLATYQNDRWVIPGALRTSTGVQQSIYSTNGTTWTLFTIPGNAAPNGAVTSIKYLNGLWFALVDSNSTATNLYTSTDFSTWTARTLPQIARPNNIAFGNYNGTNYYVIAANNGYVYYSTNGTSWTGIQPSGTVNNHNVLYFNGTFFVIRENDSGVSAYGNVLFYARVASNLTAPSSWAAISLGNASTWPNQTPGIALNYGVLMMFSSNATETVNATQSTDMGARFRMAFSRDGFTWTIRTSPLQCQNPSDHGSLMSQANGIMAFATNSYRHYATTAFNDAAFHINSTALTTV